MSKQLTDEFEKSVQISAPDELREQKEKDLAIAYVVGKKSIIKLYEINKPYAYVIITNDPLTKEMVYDVVEPTTTKKEREQIKTINQLLIETLDVAMKELGSSEKAEQYIENRIRKTVKKYHIKIKKQSLKKILYYLKRKYLGFGKIDVLMKDPLIEDISCNGINIPIYVWHRDYESIPTNIAFQSEDELDSFIIRLAYRTGRMISIAKPLLDAILPDGSRIQMSYGKQVTKHGSSFTIRKFKVEPLTIIDMIKYNTISSEMAALLWFLVENKCSVFVCGGIASGKTTMLNCLSSFIKPDAKIVTIEDTPEVQLYHKNWIRSVTRSTAGAAAEISLFDLLKTAVRQRPDYIIVGEIRGDEAYTLFQAMATGHLGMSTLHAESVVAAIHRLEAKPMDIPLKLIAGLNIMTIQARMERNSLPIRRTITMTEIVGLNDSGNDIKTNELFIWDPKRDAYEYSGKSYYLEKITRRIGKSMEGIKRDIEMRRIVLDWMVKSQIRSFNKVTEVIRNFETMPEEVYKLAKIGVKR